MSIEQGLKTLVENSEFGVVDIEEVKFVFAELKRDEEKRRGEWIECHGWERSSSGAYQCSVCGRYEHVAARHPLDWNRNFCSYCGADMRPPEEVKE